MNFQDFYGLSALIDRLKADVNVGTAVHAYLFVGPRGTAKRSMADICARALLCAGAQKPCDACAPCQRCLSGNHPDILRIPPQNNIGVDEIRTLIATVRLKPFEGGRRAIIIESADAMTPQAQNALLKTLEMPPESAVFFLIAQSTSALLPTILSRCRILRFHEVDTLDCTKALVTRGIDPARARELSELSEGSVGHALELDTSKDYWPLRDRILQALSILRAPKNIVEATALLKDDKDNASTMLSIMEHCARQLMRRDEGTEISITEKRALESISIPGDKLLMGVLNARKHAQSNVVYINLIESLFFYIVAGSATGGG